jgi:acyl carrier protein
MEKREIEKGLREIVKAQLGVEEEEILWEATFKDDLGADSLDIVEMVMAIEDVYEITILDEDLSKDENMTFGQMVDYVFERLN